MHAFQFPLTAPPGWEALRPLIERRRELGFQQGEVAAAAGFGAPYLCAVERGRVGRVTDKCVARYRAALDRLIQARVKQALDMLDASSTNEDDPQCAAP